MRAHGHPLGRAPFGVVRLLEIVTRLISLVAFVVILLIVIMAVSDVVARFGYRAPMVAFFDLMTAMQVGLMLAAASALSAGRMTSARFIWLGPRIEAGIYLIFMALIALPALAWLCTALLDSASVSQDLGEVSAGVAQIPLWPKKLVLALGFCLLTLQVLGEVLRAVQCLTAGVWPRRNAWLWENTQDEGT